MSLSFEVQLRPEDYRKVAREATRRKAGTSLLLGAVAALVAALAWSRTDSFGDAVASIASGIAAALWVYGLTALLVVPGRTARLAARMDSKVFVTPTLFELDDSRLRVTRPSSSSELTWAMFTRAWEREDVFGLELGKRSAGLPIPMRGRSQADVEQLRKFVGRVGISDGEHSTAR